MGEQMKNVFITILLGLLSTNLLANDFFASSVFDKKQVKSTSTYREISSEKSQSCIVRDEQSESSSLCYSSKSNCIKRLSFWKDSPGFENATCVTK
jgi:hypothetical protein